MDWLKKHADTVFIIAAFIGCFWTLDTKIDSLKDRFTSLEKDVAVIKTVMLMKNIMPTELCHTHAEEKQVK